MQEECISWNFIFVNTLCLIFIPQLNSNFIINEYSTDLAPDINAGNKAIDLQFDKKYNFLLVEYGIKNGNQAYGGNTTLIYCKDITKPCFVPVYVNTNFYGIIYICYNLSTNSISVFIADNKYNATYFIRVMAIGIY